MYIKTIISHFDNLITIEKSYQHSKGAANGNVTTNKGQDKTSVKQKTTKATQKYTRLIKKKKIKKSPKDQLDATQRALASRKNKVKAKVYRKYRNGDMNKYRWF